MGRALRWRKVSSLTLSAPPLSPLSPLLRFLLAFSSIMSPLHFDALPILSPPLSFPPTFYVFSPFVSLPVLGDLLKPGAFPKHNLAEILRQIQKEGAEESGESPELAESELANTINDFAQNFYAKVTSVAQFAFVISCFQSLWPGPSIKYKATKRSGSLNYIQVPYILFTDL